MSAIRKLPSGCKSPLLRHVVSRRRQVHMILNKKDSELSLVFQLRVDDFDYAVFVNSGTLKCFGCGKEGHLVRACPEIAPKNRPKPAEAKAGPSKYVDAVKQRAASIEITEENVVTAEQCWENPKKATHDDENVEIGKQVLKDPESRRSRQSLVVRRQSLVRRRRWRTM